VFSDTLIRGTGVGVGDGSGVLVAVVDGVIVGDGGDVSVARSGVADGEELA
jgi:hypothetical protein